MAISKSSRVYMHYDLLEIFTGNINEIMETIHASIFFAFRSTNDLSHNVTFDTYHIHMIP